MVQTRDCRYRVSILLCVASALGCNSPFLAKVATHAVHVPTAPPAAEIRTGGEFVEAKVFVLPSDRNLTLRQAVLQSGGLRATSPVQTHVVQPTIAPQSQLTAAPALRSDAETLRQLKDIFSRADAINAMLRYPNDEMHSRAAFQAPISDQPRLYLQIAVMKLRDAGAFTRNFDTTRLDPFSEDLAGLLEGLIYVFEQTASNNPEFAQPALEQLKTLHQSLGPGVSPASASAGASVQVAADNRPLASVSTIAVQSDQPAHLIGIENIHESGQTTYFDPQLVFKTVIGDMKLHDGDFVFGIRLADTSLSRRLDIRHELSAPVLGVSPEYSAIDPNEFRNIANVLELKSNALRNEELMLTIEDVCVLTRELSGTLQKQVYYLPVRPTEPGQQSMSTGSILPGDSFYFVTASRSPFVLERFLAPARKRLEKKASELRKRIDRRSRLPADGRFASNVAADIQYYTRPILNGARDALRAR